jgi:type II secretory pathway pseudopilin PulG
VADLLLVIAVLALVVLIVSAPLRPGRASAREASDAAERAELEAAREAKYREIRDAELDHRTGKLSEADWRALDRTLRTEAVDILRRLDALEDEPASPVRLP